MKLHRICLRGVAPARWRRVLAGAALMLSIPVGAHAATCQLSCLDAKCVVRYTDGGSAVTKQPVFDRRIRFERCEALERTQGRLSMRYVRDGQWLPPPVSLTGIGRLEEVFKRFPADRCSSHPPECLQQAMEVMNPTPGGHPIDDRHSRPGGEGGPCALGLPCGRLVPPPEAWHFALTDSTLSGTWLVRFARGTAPAGQPAEFLASVERGQVQADGRWFSPGRQYAYELSDTSGRVVASGEFSLISQSMRQRLEAIVQRHIDEGAPPAIARGDALAANNLPWDAWHQVADEGEPR